LDPGHQRWMRSAKSANAPSRDALAQGISSTGLRSWLRLDDEAQPLVFSVAGSPAGSFQIN
jgi:hypothetical protein